MYDRLLYSSIKKECFDGKIIVLVGPRQVGKTTLIQQLLQKEQHVRFFNGDSPEDKNFLHNRDFVFLDKLVGDAQYIFIDEGQKIPTIGETAKLLVDQYKNKKQIIITGSSSIHLLHNTQETLAGRKYVHTLLPLSIQEIYQHDRLKLEKEWEIRLVYGNYPEVVSAETFDKKRAILQDLTTSLLYKDILELYQVRNSSVLHNLLKALALQVCSEVSYQELGNTLDVDAKTIERYIDLLEQSFIVFRLPPFFRNKRKEISKLKKIYFYDVGIRNMLLNNLNFFDQRNDIGALWENMMIVERMKYRAYHQMYASQYFWKSYGGVEVDLVEESGGKLYGFECKWNTKKRVQAPKAWQAYPETSFTVINKDTIDGFIW